ncbi:MAG: hypothetical protein K1X78_08435 [Verrucomicrobiaceae bacterium]|nr:hypothetical protein [Verrucomicrobiaceae bacterium]
MKTYLLRFVSRAAILATAAFFPVASLAGADAKDINTVFQQGRAAYYRGDMETAKALLTQVAAAAPNHFETKALLAQINTYAKADDSLKKTYGGVVIPKIDFADVTLAEAVQALGLMSKTASGGKVSPNIIVKNPEMAKKPVTLNLANIPMTEVIDYLARMSGGRAVYEKHAVVIAPLTE